MHQIVVPDVIFKTRVKKNSSYVWEEIKSKDIFGGLKSILFSLPGAFTPTCTTYQLPGFEKYYDDFTAHGIEQIYCLSVNDAFVMNAWGKTLNISKVTLLPDGSGEFTRKMGMLVTKDNLGFGMRSWRYAAIINNCIIEKLFVEDGLSDNFRDDPYTKSTPENIMKYIKEK